MVRLELSTRATGKRRAQSAMRLGSLGERGSGHSDNDEAIVGNRNMAQCDIRKWKWECEIRTFRAENRLGEGRGHKRKLIFMAGIRDRNA